MTDTAGEASTMSIDGVHRHITSFAHQIAFHDLPDDVVYAAKVRLIDTLGVLIGGFWGESCRVARKFAARMPAAGGASVVGTRLKCMPHIAAFVNATTARYSELSDSYHWPGSAQGHASDVIAPIFAVAEYVGASGRDLATGIVLGYEIFCRLSNIFHNPGFDTTNFTRIAISAAAGKLLGLTHEQLAQSISMATASTNSLMEVRIGHLSMFKAAAAGHAGQAAIFAALGARAGMTGPAFPFEGEAGWCEQIAKERFTLDDFGGRGGKYKILDTRIKHRAAAGTTIAAILAAEKIGPLGNPDAVQQVVVEVFQRVHRLNASGEQHWNPDSRESADHSAPYVVAAALIDGMVTLRSYDERHLRDPQLRKLMRKVEVVVNDEFTRAYERIPQEHHTRVTVVMNDGERMVSAAGGDAEDQANEASDRQIEDKFRSLCEDYLGGRRSRAVLDMLWQLDEMDDVAAVPPALIIG